MAWYDEDYNDKQHKQHPKIDFEKLKHIKINFPKISNLLIILFLAWLASGFYIVDPQEVGVVKRFGKYVYTVKPGPHWHIPYPVESVLKPAITRVYRLEIGFRTISNTNPARYRMVPKESYMLTGDENIVKAEFIVQFKIKNPIKFLFNVDRQFSTIFKASEAAMREVIGKTNIDSVLTTGKDEIQQECRDLLQRIVEKYDTGVSILTVQLQDVHPPVEVINAFKDVASAKEDKERYINEAQGYRNDVIPKAKGEAAKIVNEALAYEQVVVNKALGETQRFSQVLKEYNMAKDITKKRIYIETMEQVLKHSDKVILDKDAAKKIFPLLDIKKGGVK
jgi:membrane protease subunit HflK